MKKNYTVPAKDRPALPKRTVRYRGALVCTTQFSLLSQDMHRRCNRILFDTETAYQKACASLGIEPKPREEVIAL